jgi:predicted nuclease with TOPRIM domain
MCTVDASSDKTVSFRGGGVTIGLTYPKEAHPDTNITHYVSITSSTTVTLKNFTVVIKAVLVNSSWQEILNGKNEYGFPPELPQTYNLTFPLPQDANGMLQCFIFVNTSSIDDLSATFYTTLVSDPTFSEMRVLYDVMLANYTSLKEDFATLFNDYNKTLADYDNLWADYEAMVIEYNQTATDYDTLEDDYDELSVNYDTLNDTYMALLSEHNQLTTYYNNKVSDYDTLDDNFRIKTSELGNLQTIYSALNDTYHGLQTDFNNLQIDSSTLNQSYTNLQVAFAELQESLTNSEGTVNFDRIVMFIFIVAVAILVAFIIYIKRKQEDPYLVIRKETVSMKSDEET